MLADAGYADGFSFNMNCPNDSYVNDAAICQALAAMFARVGVKADLTAETKAIHFEHARANETDMFMLGWAMLHTPGGQMGTWNPGGYSNAEVDRLTEAVATELDADKRLAMMTEAFAIAKSEVAWLPLHAQPLSWAARDGVSIPQTGDDKARLWLARID